MSVEIPSEETSRDWGYISQPKQLALYVADAPIDEAFARAPSAIQLLYDPHSTVAFSINTRHLSLAESSLGRPHMLSPLDGRFGHAVVLADFDLLGYPGDFALSWLASLLIGMGPGSEVWLELESEDASDSPRVSFTFLRDWLDAGEPEKCDEWVVLRHSPALIGCANRLATIHRCLYNAFDDLRALGKELGVSDRSLMSSFIYSLYGAMQKSLLVERVLRQAGLDGPRSILDVGSGPGYIACELAMHGHNVTILEPWPNYFQISAWLSKRCGVADRMIALNRDMRKLAEIVSDAKFDCIVFFGSLLYVSRADAAATLETASRLLNPGGVLILWEYPKELIPPGVAGREEAFAAAEMTALLRPYEGRCAYWSIHSTTASATQPGEWALIIVSIAAAAA